MTDAQKRFFMPGNTAAAAEAMASGKALPAGWSIGDTSPWYWGGAKSVISGITIGAFDETLPLYGNK